MGLDIISEGKGKCLLKEPKWSERNIHQQNIGSFGRFSYDLEMKTREQNRNNKGLVYRKDTNARGFWLVKRTLG